MAFLARFVQVQLSISPGDGPGLAWERMDLNGGGCVIALCLGMLGRPCDALVDGTIAVVRFPLEYQQNLLDTSAVCASYEVLVL